jgi:hypothetical protein
MNVTRIGIESYVVYRGQEFQCTARPTPCVYNLLIRLENDMCSDKICAVATTADQALEQVVEPR